MGVYWKPRHFLLNTREPKPRVFTHGLGSSSKSFAYNRTNSIFPIYSYYTVLLEREETEMAYGGVGVDGVACGTERGFGAGIAVVVVIILLLIAMGIVF